MPLPTRLNLPIVLRTKYIGEIGRGKPQASRVWKGCRAMPVISRILLGMLVGVTLGTAFCVVGCVYQTRQVMAEQRAEGRLTENQIGGVADVVRVGWTFLWVFVAGFGLVIGGVLGLYFGQETREHDRPR